MTIFHDRRPAGDEVEPATGVYRDLNANRLFSECSFCGGYNHDLTTCPHYANEMASSRFRNGVGLAAVIKTNVQDRKAAMKRVWHSRPSELLER